MRSDVVPGGVFPDYELSDHTAKRRKLSELQGQDPVRTCVPLSGNAGRTGTSQRPSSKKHGSRAAKNASIPTAKRTCKPSLNRIRVRAVQPAVSWPGLCDGLGLARCE